MKRETGFGRTASVWDATENARHLTIRAYDPRWRDLDTKVRRAIDSVAASASESDLLHLLKRLRFSLNCLPLPVHHPSMWGQDQPESVLETIRLHADIAANPHLEDLHAHLTDQIDEETASPLWTSTVEAWTALRKPVVVVAHKSSHIAALEALVASIDRGANTLVVKENELPELCGTRTTIIFGPPSLCADWLKAQPRGDVVWVHHMWNRGVTAPEALLPFTDGRARTPTFEDLTVGEVVDEARTYSHIDLAEESWTPFDWTRVASGPVSGPGTSSTEGADDGPILVLARVVALADDRYVLVPAEEGTTVSVFNPAVARVERRAARDIRAGMFVLVRTESGRDLVRDLVESKFLESPHECFSLLEEWKQPLRRAMRELGALEVKRALHARGLFAEEVTIRSWTTDLVYGPGNEPWLRLLLEYLGIGTPDRHWAALEALRRAGRKAGHYVRLQLLDQARQVDPVTARRESVLTFTLKGVSGGAVKAFKVEAIHTESVEAQSNELGRIR